MNYDHLDEIYLEARRLRAKFVIDSFVWAYRGIRNLVKIQWMKLRAA